MDALMIVWRSEDNLGGQFVPSAMWIWGMEPSHVEGKGAQMELPSNTRATPLSDSDGISNKKPN